MGQIDVTDLLADPDLVDDLIIIRRNASVDGFGENKVVERGEPSIGVVVPASGKTLLRLPEALRIQSVSSFFVRGKIESDGSCAYPDILMFKGSRYEVQLINDFTNWGDGWCEGVCVREKPSR